jgi:hypothetical protein
VLTRSVLTLTCEGPGGLSAARKKRPRFTCIVMYPNCKFICVERRSRTEATRRSEAKRSEARTSDPLRAPRSGSGSAPPAPAHAA